MKQSHLWSVALVVAVGLLAATTGQAFAQAQSPPAPSPHQIGLIDMAYLFKNYDKFKEQTTSLQVDAEQAEAKAQSMMQQGQQLTAQLKTLQQGSPDYNRVESELIKLKNELEVFKNHEQREIIRKQAEVYKQIYLEVESLVEQYAKYYKYTLIIRFNRAEVAEAGDPQAIIQNMNRQVVYYQPQDDITDAILKVLNDQYKNKKTAGAR